MMFNVICIFSDSSVVSCNQLPKKKFFSIFQVRKQVEGIQSKFEITYLNCLRWDDPLSSICEADDFTDCVS